MRYRHRVPRPPLDAFIESIWVYRNDPRPHALERILPTGAAQLIVNLKEDQTRLYDPECPHRCVATSGSVLSGVQSRFQVIDTSEQEYVAGVAFKPGGTVPFMRMPAHEASDADVPLESLWGRRRYRRSPRTPSRKRRHRCDARCARSCTPGDVASAGAASGRHLCVGRLRSSAADDEHRGGDGRDRAEREAIHRAIQDRSGHDAEALLSDPSIPARRGAGEPRAVTSIGRGWRSTAATSIRRTSFTTSGRSRASRRPRISRPGRRFRTTSNFYNPSAAASETMTPWLIQKTRIAR